MKGDDTKADWIEPAEPKGFLAGGRPFRPKQKADLSVCFFYWSGLRVSEVKTIKYRFYRSKVPRCEKTKKQTFRSASSIGADYVARKENA